MLSPGIPAMSPEPRQGNLRPEWYSQVNCILLEKHEYYLWYSSLYFSVLEQDS